MAEAATRRPLPVRGGEAHPDASAGSADDVMSGGWCSRWLTGRRAPLLRDGLCGKGAEERFCAGASRRRHGAALGSAAGWLALIFVAGCLVQCGRAAGIQEGMLEPVPPMEVDLPAELIEELAMMEAGHPTMRRLLQEANATNSSNTTNATFFLENVGTTYSCVAKSEYKAIATDFSLTGKSRQYTDGSFFCEDYVDYAAACDLNDLRHSCNNREAKRLYDNFERALSVYSCKSYSRIWTCTNCKKAYKRWLCGQANVLDTAELVDCWPPLLWNS